LCRWPPHPKTALLPAVADAMHLECKAGFAGPAGPGSRASARHVFPGPLAPPRRPTDCVYSGGILSQAREGDWRSPPRPPPPDTAGSGGTLLAGGVGGGPRGILHWFSALRRRGSTAHPKKRGGFGVDLNRSGFMANLEVIFWPPGTPAPPARQTDFPGVSCIGLRGPASPPLATSKRHPGGPCSRWDSFAGGTAWPVTEPI
jgi:hypothetical protein